MAVAGDNGFELRVPWSESRLKTRLVHMFSFLSVLSRDMPIVVVSVLLKTVRSEIAAHRHHHLDLTRKLDHQGGYFIPPIPI